MDTLSARRPVMLAAALAVCALLAVVHPLPGRTQDLKLGQPLSGAGAPQPPPPPATAYAPERIRTALSAIHGFTREQLDGISIQVPQILMGFIDDPKESVLVRRQAIKALQLYPGDGTFRFIRQRLPAAPPSLKVLLLGSLAPYASTRSAELVPLLQAELQSPDVVVRHAAVSLAAQAGGQVQVRSLLSTHLANEPERSVRSAIETALSAN